MLITKTPFRVSFCGGGSDLSAFYKQYGGCVLSTSIDKYMYISIHPYFNTNQILLKYSETELVDDVKNINHKIFHAVLESAGVSGIQISSISDVPAGTGLGSSSSFTVGLLNCLYAYQNRKSSKEQLANEACEIEIDKLGSPIGKQDQYAAAYGGLNFIQFLPDDSVTVSPIHMNAESRKMLEMNLIMFYTGSTRSANQILQEQKHNILQNEKNDNLRKMCSLAVEMKNSLENDELSSFGAILHEGWERKRELASQITNPQIDYYYHVAMKNGALGGKLLGAGGGGFLLFYCEKEKQERLRHVLKLQEFQFGFDQKGTTIIYNDTGIGE